MSPKNFTRLAALFLAAGPAAPSALAQAPAQKPAAPAGTAAPAPKPAAAPGVTGRVAVINTSAFQDETNGIKSLAAAFNKIATEFEPKRLEMVALQTKLTALQGEVSAMTETTDAAVKKAKTDELEAMKQEFQKKNEEAQGAYQARMEAEVAPLFTEVGTAMEAYAKKNGIAALLDAAKLRDAIYVVNESIDITKAFIADYNRTHPAAPAAATPAKP